MLDELIARKKKQWLEADACPVKGLLDYMRKQGRLREPQVEAISAYLFLKIAGGNKPLWRLFAENFFTPDLDLARLKLSEATRRFLEKNEAARALYAFSIQPQEDGKPLLPELEGLISDDPAALDCERIIKEIFYDVSYADYLMSLPMGAGKTFLMAAIIYLDLLFARNEPANPVFAHNFIVLIPSGLKSSIAPSLKTIKDFDPEWVIPNPAANQIRRELSFEILDEQKSGKSSNRVRNPNVQKVSRCFPHPYANVFVVNAEKVILDRLDERAPELIERSEDQRDQQANELRNWLGKIPNLSIMIDEVHHAATADIKLRQVVNRWQQSGKIVSVLGFSGTPYLSNNDQAAVSVNEEVTIQFPRIANTVYYYPLIQAVRSFLKKPQVKIAQGVQERLALIREGVEDFQARFGAKRYADGAIAKLAIYCGDIETLEDEVYPFLTGDLNIREAEILRFHRGNKAHPVPPGAELAFRSLDRPARHAAPQRYILLVQIGKEGWDCRSLTGVILSQQGDCPRNMVLQTSCRCLRQVDAGAAEEALIWLNDGNAKTLNAQLGQQQRTSIKEINSVGAGVGEAQVERHSRMKQLELPALDFYQLRVNYQDVIKREVQTEQALQALCDTLEDYRDIALTIVTDFEAMESEVKRKYGQGLEASRDTDIKAMGTGELNIRDVDEKGQPASFTHWLHDIAKEGFYTISTDQLRYFKEQLRAIFDKIAMKQPQGEHCWNESYDRYAIESRIRLAFSPRRELRTSFEVIPDQAELLLVDKLGPVDFNDKLYPNEADTRRVLRLDKNPEPTTEEERQEEWQKARQKIQQAIEALKEQGMDASQLEGQLKELSDQPSVAVAQRDKSFHYLPYNFVRSGFELELLRKVLSLRNFQDSALEIYYNGERGLTGFVIQCFQKKGNSWRNIGRYTTDFLIIQRGPDKKAIRKALMVETKGEGYAHDPNFQARKSFVESKFLEQNKEQFGYDKFDFLYLQDTDSIDDNIAMLNRKITKFFAGEQNHAG